MSKPIVTVLLCTRDRKAQLENCLKSLIALNYDDFEVIIVDNASQKIEIPQLDYRCRVRFFSQPVPGLSSARNSVLCFAEGEVIALLDDDAVADPDWLTNAIPHFEDPKVAAVVGKILPFKIETEWQERQIRRRERDEAIVFDKANYHPLTTFVGTGSNVLIHKTFLNDHHFPELFGPGTPVMAGDENYLFYEMIRDGWHIHYEPRAIVSHDFVKTKEEYEQRTLRVSIARTAYLTKFLFTESNHRLATLRHVIRKGIFANKNGQAKGMAGAGLKCFWLGPLALIRSFFTARKKRMRLSTPVLLMEYPRNTISSGANSVEWAQS